MDMENKWTNVDMSLMPPLIPLKFPGSKDIHTSETESPLNLVKIKTNQDNAPESTTHQDSSPLNQCAAI